MMNGKLKKNIIIRILFLFLPLLLITGCLKDNANPADSFTTSDAINMLVYFEANGDIINSPSTKSTFVNAQELYSSLSNFVVLDIRTPQLFTTGHINGAINIQSSDLLGKVKSIDTANVILVSQNGQSASYYGGLLRLDGLSDVYILKFGMAGWNSQFASQWDSSNGFNPSGRQYFNAVNYGKGPYTDLPDVKLNSSGDIKTKIEDRIQSLLSEKFEDGVTYVDSTTSSLSIFGGDAFHADIFSLGDSTFDNEYIICYDTLKNYILPGSRNVYSPDHPPHAVLYSYYKDFKSIYYLQTIPTNKNIVIYSFDGHQSAFAMAYLRLMGYKVKSVLFGATWLRPFPGSMNYPYTN